MARANTPRGLSAATHRPYQRAAAAADTAITVTDVIRIIGRSGSGKTTLLCEVVRLLSERGLRVAVFKHAHHRVDLDRKGKDSFRFAAAGAAFVTVVSPEKVAAFEAVREREPSLEELCARAPQDVDLVLTEGFHAGSTPYFLLLDQGAENDDRGHEGELLGVIGRGAPSNAAGMFDRTDAAGVARAIEAYLARRDARERELGGLFREAAAYHGHLCPGQVLGVRMALVGCRAAGVAEPRSSKKLIVWVETDRCGTDAVQTVTGCKLGKRTLKHVDIGKMAATFLNTETGVAVRVSARSDSRAAAAAAFPGLEKHAAQLEAYRTLPEEKLFDVERVSVRLGDLDRPGKPTVRVVCTACGEEVSDGRHVEGDDGPLCRSCAGGAYYQRLEGGVKAEGAW
jgi:formylmethanofuran dehydrogenase subunit E